MRTNDPDVGMALVTNSRDMDSLADWRPEVCDDGEECRGLSSVCNFCPVVQYMWIKLTTGHGRISHERANDLPGRRLVVLRGVMHWRQSRNPTLFDINT